MTVLLKQATIICPSSPFNGQTKDILIIEGIITKIGDALSENNSLVIELPNLHVSIGWMDILAHFCDPGFEYRETLETGTNAAAAGGFTDVMVLPNTNPVVYNKSQVEYIVQKSKTLPVNIYPIGAVTKNAEGNELAEMYDMQQSGAVTFSDGINAIQSSGLLIKALQYIKAFNGTLIQIPDDKSIAANGLMNEGIISTQLGLPGKPAMAEELIVARDIKLARYADSRLHFTGITTAKSLEYIKRAKAGGIQISCSVTPYHLFFCDEDLTGYDTNLKVNPPLRTKTDRDALLKGLMDGTVDGIASHHIPQNYDGKVCEFEYAKNGMIGLESLFGTLWSIVDREWSIEHLVERLSVSPRRLFGIPLPEIKEGADATLTLFDPSVEYVFDESMIASKSKNSAFIGKKLKGKVIGIINKKQAVLNKWKQLKAPHIGLITGSAMIGVSLLSFYVLKLPIESNFQLLNYSIFTGGVVWSLLLRYKAAKDNSTFKDYFNAGFKTFVIVALLMAVFTYIFFSFNTDFRDTKIAENNRLILAEGNHLPQEIEENAKRLRKLFMPIMVSSAMFRYLIIGALVSVVGAGFLSQQKKLPD